MGDGVCAGGYRGQPYHVAREYAVAVGRGAVSDCSAPDCRRESRIPREIGETGLRVNGLEATRIVAFGDEDVPPLLGAATLQGILLVV